MGAEVDGRFLPLMFVLGTVLAVSATVVILHRLFSTHGGMAYMHGVRATQGGDASSGIPQYKEAPWESYCSEKFGRKLVENWGASAEEYCAPGDNREATVDGARMTCFRFSQHERANHHNHDARSEWENQCRLNNLRLDYSKLAQTGASFGKDHPRYGRGWTGAAVRGTLRLQCASTPSFSVDKFRKSQQLIMRGLTMAAGGSALACDTTVSHPVVFVTRYEYGNLYHSSTDWMNVVLASAVMGFTLDEAQIVLMDFHPNTFVAAYEALAPSHPVLRAPNLTGTHCYHTAVFPVIGYGCPFFVDERADECRESGLLMAFRRRMLAGFGLLNASIVAEPRFTVIHRSDLRGDIADSRILERLQAVYGRDAARSESFEKLPLRSQVDIVGKHTNILVGVHGAGLTHMLWLPRGSAVVEVFGPRGAKNKAPMHFRNLAHWLGLTYIGIKYPQANRQSPTGEREVDKFMRAVDGVVRVIRHNWKAHNNAY